MYILIIICIKKDNCRIELSFWLKPSYFVKFYFVVFYGEKYIGNYTFLKGNICRMWLIILFLYILLHFLKEKNYLQVVTYLLGLANGQRASVGTDGSNGQWQQQRWCWYWQQPHAQGGDYVHLVQDNDNI